MQNYNTIKHKIATGIIKRFLVKYKKVAWTSLWNTIYYIDENTLKNKKVKKHELKHIEQMEREGKLKFTVKYLWYSITRGYFKNPYEVEARKAENTTV